MKKIFISFLLVLICSLPLVATVRNVKTTCGAIGNDVADDTTAIATCIGQLVSGDTLLFPLATYKASGNILFPTYLNNITVDAAGSTIHLTGINTGIFIGVTGNAGQSFNSLPGLPNFMGPAIALNSTPAELATSFTTVSPLGVVAGDHIYIFQGGLDSSQGSDAFHCDTSGCRAETLEVASVSGNTVTVTTALHDTYSPSLNGAKVAKFNSKFSGWVVKDLILACSGSNGGLYGSAMVNPTFTNITITNSRNFAFQLQMTYGVTITNLNTSVPAVANTFTFGLYSHGHTVINGFTGVRGGSFFSSGSDATVTNFLVDGQLVVVGRPFKTTACRYCTFNGTTVKNGISAFNGISLEYYTSHTTFNNCIVTGNQGGAGSGNAGVNSFGNFNQFNTFDGCTITGNGNVQFYISNFDNMRLGQDNNITIRNSTVGGPGQGILIAASNGCVNNNTLVSGSNLSPGISVSGSNNIGLGNVLNGFSSNLIAGMCGPANTPPSAPTSLNGVVQ